jgi:hypothetical protein
MSPVGPIAIPIGSEKVPLPVPAEPTVGCQTPDELNTCMRPFAESGTYTLFAASVAIVVTNGTKGFSKKVADMSWPTS